MMLDSILDVLWNIVRTIGVILLAAIGFQIVFHVYLAIIDNQFNPLLMILDGTGAILGKLSRAFERAREALRRRS